MAIILDGTAGITTPSITNSGSTTLSGGTANGVAYLNGSKVLTTGSAFQFDGSNLGLGVTPSAWNSSWKALQLNNGSIASNGTVFDLPQNIYYGAGGSYIYSTTAAASLYRQYAGQHQFFNAVSGTAGTSPSLTQAMTLDASGRLLIGTTSNIGSFDMMAVAGANATANDLTLYGPSASQVRLTFSKSGTNGVGEVGYNMATDALRFVTASNERMRIDSSGNWMLGKTVTSITTVGVSALANGRVMIANAASTGADDGFQIYSTGASAYRFYVSMAGVVYATSTTISAISDQRLKENIRDLDDGLDAILALKPRLYDWKEGKGANIKNDRGFIAQEFEQVFPDLIDEWKDPAPEGEEPYKSVRQDLIPVLVKAIQELKAELDAANARIEQLEAK